MTAHHRLPRAAPGAPSLLSPSRSDHDHPRHLHLHPHLPIPFLLFLFLSLLLPAALVGAQSTVTSSPVFATWTIPSTSSTAPSARCDQLLTTVEYATSSTLFLFGGNNPGAGQVNDVWLALFNGNEVEWSQMPTSTTMPSPRYGAGGAVVTQPAWSSVPAEIYVFGGVDESGEYLDDIWTFVPGPNTWDQIRPASFDRVGSSVYSIQTTQPSARTYSQLQTVEISYGALRGLPADLITENLDWYLNLTENVPNVNVTVALLLFGGRSDPTNFYSTTTATGPVASSTMSDPSSFNADYGDLWLYLPSMDVWVRIGNATCDAPVTLCSDSTSIANLSSNVVPTLLSALTSLSNQPVRPAALIDRTEQLLNGSSQLLTSLQGVLSYLLSTPGSSEPPPNQSCYDVCDNPTELPSPTLYNPPYLNCAGTGGSISSSGAWFCNVTASGIVVSQVRPNASEGYASATHTIGGTTYYWQFGGFSCFTGGVDVFSITSWVPECFTQGLSLLDPTTLVWYTFALPPVATTQILWWPTARAYATMAIDADREQIWVYGGAAVLSGQWQYYNDLRVFDLPSLSWLETQISGVTPLAVRGASLVWVPALSSSTQASGIFLFGGCNPGLSTDQFLQLQTSASVSAANWLAAGPALHTATAGVGGAFTLTAEALFANNSFAGQLTYGVGLASFFTVIMSEINSEGALVPLVYPSVNEVGNGLYTVNYTLEFGSLYQIDIKFQQDGVAVPIHGSPFSLTLLPALYSPSHTEVAGTNYSQVEKNAQASITMQLVDEFGNEEINSAAPNNTPTFTLFYLDPSSPGANNVTLTNDTDLGILPSILIPVSNSVVDNGDGSYTLFYQAPSLSTYYLYVFVNSENSYGSPYTVTGLDRLALSSAIQISFLVLSVVLGALVLLVMLGIIRKRNDRVVRAGSPLFLVLICVGVLMSIASVPVYAWPGDVTCRLFPFLLTTGYIVALSALFTKSYRVLLLFVSNHLTTVSLTDTTMLFPVFVLVLMETVLNLCWLIADPLVLVTYDATSVQPYQACGGPHAVAFVSASVAFNGLIAVWGVYLAIRIRNVPEAFNESKLMGGALYNLALMLVIAIPLTWTATSTQTSHEDYLIPAAAILWCCAVTVATTVAPKLYYVMNPPPASFFDAYTPQQGVMIKGVKGRLGPMKQGSWDETRQASPVQQSDVKDKRCVPGFNQKRWGSGSGCADGAKDQVEIEIGCTPPYSSEKDVGADVPALAERGEDTSEKMDQDESKEEAAAREEEQEGSPSTARRQRPAPISIALPAASEGNSLSLAAMRLPPPAQNHSERSRVRKVDGDHSVVPSPAAQHSAGPLGTPLSKPSAAQALTASNSLDDLAYLPRVSPAPLSLPPGPVRSASRTSSPASRGYAMSRNGGVQHSPFRLPPPSAPASYQPPPLSLGGSPVPGSRVMEMQMHDNNNNNNNSNNNAE